MAVAPTWSLQQRCVGTLLVISLLVAVIPISCTSVEETETPPLEATRLCLSNQSSALLRFKHSLHSFLQPETDKLTSWQRNGSDCCHWEGVTCGSLTGFIIALQIPSVTDGYSGNIPSSLFELKHLQHLDLSWNSFTGTIPNRLVELAHLTHVDLSWCSFSGQVPVELSQMTRLISLNLSGNDALQLQKPNFTALVRGLAQLQHLQLNEVRISMRGTDVSSALSSSSLQKLQTLSLSYCNISSPLDDELDLHLQSLLHLNLGGNNLQRVLKFLENLTSLNDLDLSDCGLQGKFPESIFLLPKLETLDLSYNEELVVSLPTKNLTRSANIRYLILSSIKELFDDLLMPSPPQPPLDMESNVANKSVSSFCSSNGISFRNLSSNTPPGTLLQGLCSFTYLTYLEIHNSSLYGTVPTCLFSLSSLQKVDLSENSLSGTISMSSLSSLQELDLSKNSLNGIDPMCLFSASSLEWLDLSYNCLSGSIPSSLFTLPSLRSLNLGYNRLNGSLPELYNPTSNLEELYLNDNLLSGDVPSFMKNLPSLQLVFLSSNDFTGMINVSLFLSLKGLVHLDVSNNKRLKAEFSHPSNHTHDTFMNLSPLQLLNFSSCNIQSFPRFICHFQRLQQLDLSYNNIGGKIPSCLWSISGLENLVLDQNKLDGFQKPVNITGSIDSRSAFSLTTSSNQIKGPIPAFLCNFTALGFAYLDMSNNSLTGAIPNCIYKMKGVKLRRNHLQGQLPSEIFENLELLNLNGNFLTGKIRKSLSYSTNLKALDLGSNELDDTFPAWLGQLDQLEVLVLRSNHLHGPIWASSFPQAFPALKILDISDNHFSGTLPHELFQGLEAIMSKNSEAEDSLIIGDSVIGDSVGSWEMEETIKGKVHFIKEIRWAMNFIDLSNNMFIGKIPKGLGMLKNLRGLNVSNNHLDGPIPKSLGNLLQMEQLDLSQNHLSGVIPVELVSLTFLSVLLIL